MENGSSPDRLTGGAELFCLYAQPPNVLGYCGPSDESGVSAVAGGLALPAEEMARLALAFDGAWPYLEMIGGLTGREPLSAPVVEAYWKGNEVLGSIPLFEWGNSVSDRFRKQADGRWPAVEEALNSGGTPNHAFHVFCVYPWVGLLREGFVGPSLEVLDRCRIGWGRVTGVGEVATVSRRPLVWADGSLRHGEPVEEPFRPPQRVVLQLGDLVSLHWDYICERLDVGEMERLRMVHDRHLAIANRELLTARLEPAR